MAESITAFFTRLGFPFNNPRWSWGAAGPEDAVLLRTWQDDVTEKGKKVTVFRAPTAEGNWELNAGRSERRSHVERIWKGGIAAYTVIATAHDMKARPRKIAGFRRDVVFAIERLQQEPDGSISAVLSSPPLPIDRLKSDALTRRVAANAVAFPIVEPDDGKVVKPVAASTPPPSSYLETLPPMRKRLIEVARRKEMIRYGELMAEFGLGRFNLRRVMSRLGFQCQQSGEPILTALIVSKATGRCSAGLAVEFGIADDGVERERCYLYWADNAADSAADAAALAERARRFAEIETRPEQAEFRLKVFTACKERCVVSGCGVSATLDAAHLKGRDWRVGHNNVEDGMLLRADLHRLYDAGLLAISDMGVVTIDAKIASTYGDYDGFTIRLAHLWPRPAEPAAT
jgi:hypothetical protein